MTATTSDWNPGQYLRFAGHRLRPALDLLGRIAVDEARTVYDLGCGPGNVTPILAERWPGARVVGLDASAEMLARATAAPGVEYRAADLNAWVPDAPADVLYSNAALQWLGGHETLFPRLFEFLRPGGVLAVQMPRNHAAPSHVGMVEAAENTGLRDVLAPVLRRNPVAEPTVYYDLLSPRAAALEMWETIYIQALEGDNAVVEWTKGSALRPLIDALEGAARDAYLAEYTRLMAAAYPRRADGRTLLPFRRLFIVATR